MVLRAMTPRDIGSNMCDLNELSNVPDWLKPGMVFQNEVLRMKLLDDSSNWMRLSEAQKDYSELDCLQVIILELAGKQRFEIVDRMKKRYNMLRLEREQKELWSVISTPRQDT